MKKWLFNPFIYIAGVRSLIIGLVVMAITALICSFSHTHFNGLLQIGSRDTAAWRYFFEGFVVWLIPVIVFYVAGLIFSKSSIRLIDVAGTFALARWVMLFSAFTGFGMNLPDMNHHTIDDLIKAITPSFIALGLVSLVCMVWMIALLYNAFVISCNIRKEKSVVLFIICLLIAEIAARLIIHFI